MEEEEGGKWGSPLHEGSGCRQAPPPLMSGSTLNLGHPHLPFLPPLSWPSPGDAPCNWGSRAGLDYQGYRPGRNSIVCALPSMPLGPPEQLCSRDHACRVACFSHCGCQALPSTMTESPGSLGDIEQLGHGAVSIVSTSTQP